MKKQSFEQIEKLVALATLLVDKIDEVATKELGPRRKSIEETARVIRIHLDALLSGIQEDSPQTALRGVNLLSTTNRGLGDESWAEKHPDIVELGKQVTDESFEAARRLRADLGMGY